MPYCTIVFVERKAPLLHRLAAQAGVAKGGPNDRFYEGLASVGLFSYCHTSSGVL
jgi:hypothetical protein